jgi:hypothetical protein
MNIKQFIYHSFLVIVAFFSCFNDAAAQAVTTSIDRSDILIGEPIKYEIKINLASSSYKIDIGLPDSIPHFEFIDQSKYDTVDKNGMYTLRQNILFTCFDSGVWKIPSFPVTISFPNKASQKYLSDSFLVKVGYSAADSTGQLRDIKPVLEVFVIDRQWLYIAASVALALLLVFFIYRIFKNRKKKIPALFDAVLSPYDEAIKALKLLQQQTVANTDSLKLFYMSLSDIFKKYYSRKTNKNLMSETTGDLLLLLQTQVASTETVSSAAQALRCGDAVKFAKYIPSAPENIQSVSLIKTVIEQIEKNSNL